MKLGLRVLLFLFLFFPFSKLSFASYEFKTVYDVLIEADSSGRVNVKQDISLTNKLSNIYATSYSLRLEKGKPENIYVSDSKGQAKTTIETNENETIIKVEFNDQVVGVGKTLSFTLTYDAPDLIRKKGRVWELIAPKLAEPEEIDEYVLKVKVPYSFGKLAYVSPNPQSQKIEKGSQIFIFNKNQIASSGVIAAFGDFQVFDFTLNYHLNNTKEETVFQKIALPPDTAYQKVSYWQIIPEPENIETDQDGNWLGIFKLKPRENLLITVHGQVRVFAQPVLKLPEAKTSLNDYLAPKRYWEVDDPEIIEMARKLKNPRAIHEFVVSILEYDYSRARIGATRLGAKTVLKSPDRAICMEYTDLFISLARAAGIPARELNGFAYTNNPYLRPLSMVQDVLHSWPEYWDEEKETWIQIDPTWQDTTGGINYFDKFDLDHIVFAIHGQDSDYPPPAGAYKEPGASEKDVRVSFGKPREEKPIFPTIEFLLPKSFYSEKPILGTIVLKNLGAEAITDTNLEIMEKDLNIQILGESNFSLIPPFSKRLIPIRVSSKNFLSKGTGTLIVLLRGQKTEYNLLTNSLILGLFLPVFGGLLGATTIFIIARKIRRIYIQERQERNSLYRQGSQSSSKS